MGTTTETNAWTVFVDGRTHQIVMERDKVTTMFSIERNHRVLVNGSVVVTGKTTSSDVKFSVGKHKCKVCMKWGFSGASVEGLLVDGKDAGEFQPPAHYFPSEASQAAPGSGRRDSAREEQLEAALERLQDRLVNEEISEETYIELKEAMVRRFEEGGALPKAPAEKIVERQIVVTHCKFCNELTPVDLSACKSCGARIR